jgi:hypothetical protein
MNLRYGTDERQAQSTVRRWPRLKDETATGHAIGDGAHPRPYAGSARKTVIDPRRMPDPEWMPTGEPTHIALAPRASEVTLPRLRPRSPDLSTDKPSSVGIVRAATCRPTRIRATPPYFPRRNKEFSMRFTSNPARANRMGAALASLALIACAWLPGTASAQGILMGSADLDGDNVAETVYNNGSYISVKSANGSSYNYQTTTGGWGLLNGDFSSVKDLDGTPGAEIPINIGPALKVINHNSRSSYNYPMSGSWAASPGGITDLDGIAGNEIAIVASDSLRIVNHRSRSTSSSPMSGTYAIAVYGIKDLDGQPGAEIPIANGSALRIYNYRTRSMSSMPVNSGSWAICNDPGIPNCVSDMNGTPGAELVLIQPNFISVYSYVTGSMSNYAINAQYAILSDGVRDFNGTAGNEIAVARNDGHINIIYPRTGTVQFINGTNTFGTWWSLLNYANLDGVAGDEIRVRNNGTARNYRIYPRSGIVSAE